MPGESDEERYQQHHEHTALFATMPASHVISLNILAMSQVLFRPLLIADEMSSINTYTYVAVDR